MSQDTKPRNIYIVGAQCTGKTTLVNALGDHFNTTEKHGLGGVTHPKFITEVARTVLKEHKFTAEDITSSPARSLVLQRLILQAQLDAEDAFSARDDWFISDRSGADPIVYARKYVGEQAASELVKSREFSQLRERMRNSVVIVCEAGADWLTDDGVRLMPQDTEDWIAFHKLFCMCLDEWGLGYNVLPKDLGGVSDRVAFVLERWE